LGEEEVLSGLDELRLASATCQHCELAATRTQVVFSSGPSTSPLVLLGEAPGAEEDARGIPFVGQSGQLLVRLLSEVGLDRDSLYVTNVVKCRPPENRTPTKDEVATCAQWLEPQLRALAPAVIVALGAVAAKSVLGNQITISKVRGQRFEGPFGSVIPTFHPAYGLRGGAAVVEQIRSDLAVAAELVKYLRP
jgi:DNA polymerase